MISEEIVPKEVQIWSKVFASLSKGRQCCLSLRLNFGVKCLAPDTDTGISINIYASKRLQYECCDLSANTIFYLHTNVLRFKHLV